MSKNRRRHPRVRARGVAAHLRGERGRIACQVENISMGGIFVRTDQLEDVGAEILVDLVKPGWKRQLSFRGRVSSRVDALDGRLSHRMPGMGIQLHQLDEKQHDRLRSLLRELGAAEEDLEVTLPDESTEAELRALDLGPASEGPHDLSPEPQPLWQQVQMVEKEARAAGSIGSLADDIAGALREANLPPPGPLELAPEPPPGAEAARLMLQIRGLVMQLAEAQQELVLRDQEIARLRDDLAVLRSALEGSMRNS